MAQGGAGRGKPWCGTSSRAEIGVTFSGDVSIGMTQSKNGGFTVCPFIKMLEEQISGDPGVLSTYVAEAFSEMLYMYSRRVDDEWRR